MNHGVSRGYLFCLGASNEEDAIISAKFVNNFYFGPRLNLALHICFSTYRDLFLLFMRYIFWTTW